MCRPSRAAPRADEHLFRQNLEWYRGKLLGEEVPEPPGPLAMGIQTTREFDMWGNESDLARLVNDVEEAIVRKGFIGRA